MSENDKLRRDADAAKKELVEAFQEELKDVSNKDDEKEPNALRVLMQIVTASNTSDMKKVTKTIRRTHKLVRMSQDIFFIKVPIW